MEPKAGQYLQALKSGMGDAFTADDNSVIGVERIAIARMLAHADRTGQRLIENYTGPGTSWSLLSWWAEVLGVSITTDDPNVLRQTLIARYRVTQGNGYNHVKDALATILGTAFVDLRVHYGVDLDNPPHPTHEGGSSANDLGNGDWQSARCHLLLLAEPTAALPLDTLQDLITTQAFDLMGRVLPAFTTFTWAASIGFILDESPLDYTALDD